MNKNGQCNKCMTTMIELTEYNDNLLCDGCLEEEKEKDSEKHIIDEEKLEEYRNLVNGTKGIQVSKY